MRLLQAAEESRGAQDESLRTRDEELARKQEEALPGPPKTLRRGPAVAAAVIGPPSWCRLLALTLGGVFKAPESPPLQQASTNAPAPEASPAPAPQSTTTGLPGWIVRLWDLSKVNEAGK